MYSFRYICVQQLKLKLKITTLSTRKKLAYKIPTRKILNPLNTHEKKKLDPPNTHEKKFKTHEIPKRKNFRSTRYPQRHNGAITLDPRSQR